MRSSVRLARGVSCIAVLVVVAAVRAEGPPAIKELRTQRVGDTTYFHVRFEQPEDLALGEMPAGPYGEADRRKLAQRPQLVPREGCASAVYPRLATRQARPNVGFREAAPAPPIEGLEFVGKLADARAARLLLLYPTRDRTS